MRTVMSSRKLIVMTTAWLGLWSAGALGEPPAVDIHTAARAGDLDQISALVAQSPELVNARDGRGNTPLHLAVQELKLESVKRLLAAGADVKAQNALGAGALHFVAYAGSPERDTRSQRAAMAALLIESGANVQAVDRRGMTPLHVAAVKGRDELLELLITAKADIKANDSGGRTPLHYAAMYNHKGTIDWLTRKGADINATDDEGETPLHSAVRRFRKVATDRLIANGAKVDAKNQKGQTALHIAATEGPQAPEVDALVAAVAEVLLAAGADVNAKDQAGATPLHDAIKKGRTKLADTLRRHGGIE